MSSFAFPFRRIAVPTFSALILASTAFAEGDKKPDTGWNHIADVGFVQTAGNSEVTTLSAAEKSAYKSSGWRAETAFSLLYGKTAGVKTNEQWKAGLRVDRDLSSRLSFFGTAGYEKNEFAGISRRTEEGLGLSFRAIDASPTWLRFDSGLALIQQRDLADVTSSTTALRLADAFKRSLGSNVDLTQNAEFLQSLEDGDDLRLNADVGIAAPISTSLALKLAYQVKFDNQPEPGFKKTDRIFVAGLQLKF